VTITVSAKRTQRGGMFAFVTDFLADGTPTAAEVVSGVPDDPAKAAEAVERANDPEPVITTAEFDRLNDDLSDEQAGPDVVPVDDAIWAELMATVGRCGKQGRGPTPDQAPDQSAPTCCDDEPSDADEDAEAFHWVLCAGEGPDATVTCVDWDEVAAQHETPKADAVPLPPQRSSLFEFGNETRTYLAAHGGVLDRYVGVAWSRWLPVSLRGARGLEDVLEPARRLCRVLETIGVPRRKIVIFNIQNRGLRVCIPSACASAYPQMGFEAAAGHFWQLLANVALIKPEQLRVGLDGVPLPKDPTWYSPIDRSIYKPNAMLPAVNTPCSETGLFTVVVHLAELETMSAGDLEQLAHQSRPFAWPSWRAAPVELLANCWKYAVDVEQSRSGRCSAVVGGEPWVFSDTFAFISTGAPHGDAKVCLIRAAMNLLRFNAPVPLLLALLAPGAALSGLDRHETSDLIDWAVKRHRANGGRAAGQHDAAELKPRGRPA